MPWFLETAREKNYCYYFYLFLKLINFLLPFAYGRKVLYCICNRTEMAMYTELLLPLTIGHSSLNMGQMYVWIEAGSKGTSLCLTHWETGVYLCSYVYVCKSVFSWRFYEVPQQCLIVSLFVYLRWSFKNINKNQNVMSTISLYLSSKINCLLAWELRTQSMRMRIVWEIEIVNPLTNGAILLYRLNFN